MNILGGTAGRGRIGALAVLLAVLFCAPSIAHAATLFVTPSTGQFAVGQTFNVVIRVNSQGGAVNASEGLLGFNPAQLQVQAITSTGSIFNLNVREPEFSNSAGTVRWTGVILNPGYSGASGNLITVRFKGVAQGTTSVAYRSGAVLANDGAGTNVLTGMSGGTYTIGSTLATPTTTPSVQSGAPVITSPTHPDSLAWYSNNDPVFQWVLPAGVEGVSYLVNEKASANPGNASDGLLSEVKLKDVAEGATFIHVKFRSAGVWGPVAHFPFNVDTIAPEAFRIIREDGSDVMNPQPLFSFVTSDSGSGLARYMMKIGDGDWFEVNPGTEHAPFALPLQYPGSRTVLVEAIDRAGNSTRSSLDIRVESIPVPIITLYPESVGESEGFIVGGTSDPQTTIRVEAIQWSGIFGSVLYNDRPSTTVETQSDSSGNWTVVFGSQNPGSYRIRAIAVNARGAQSYPSESVVVRIGYGILNRLEGFARGLFDGEGIVRYLFDVILFLLILLCVAVLAHGKEWEPWRLPAVMESVEKKELSKLRALATDIDEELILLGRVGKHRPLYPEEKYLKSKLLQYQRTLRALMRDPRNRLAKRS